MQCNIGFNKERGGERRSERERERGRGVREGGRKREQGGGGGGRIVSGYLWVLFNMLENNEFHD